MQIKISFTAIQLKGMLEGLRKGRYMQDDNFKTECQNTNTQRSNKSKNQRENCQAGRDSKLYQ